MALQILVALDGSQWSRAAGAAAITLAERAPEAVQITALHVLTVTHLRGELLKDLAGMLGFEPVIVPASVEGVFRDRGRRILDRFAADCAAAGLSCRGVIDQGAVLERVLHHGAAADLVIAGTRGETEAAYPGHGGTLERLVKRLPVSALLVPAGGLALRGITVGYDGSEGGQRALRVAAKLSGWTGAPVQVVYVLDGRRRGGDPLDEARDLLEDRGIQPKLLSAAGEPHELLPAAMLDAGHDVLVVGFRGRSSMARRLLGRVTERLLEDASLGLLVAR